MGFEFDVSKLQIDLQAVRAKMAKDGQRRAVLAGAKVIAAAMEAGTPVLAGKDPTSDSLEPGELKGNIRARGGTEDGAPVGFAGPYGAGGKYAKIAYNVEYGHRIVVGSRSQPGPDGKFHGGGVALEKEVPPHPFLRPAFEGSAAEALTAMGQAKAETLREAVR